MDDYEIKWDETNPELLVGLAFIKGNSEPFARYTIEGETNNGNFFRTTR